MKTIFLTNDDGFDSVGLVELANALKSIARVVVVAPAQEKSACGHGLCVSKPLRLIEVNKDYYKLDDGTPTDCVYVGLHELLENKPNLLISGINIGANLGEDTTYSGTVAGAIEGALHGIPSIAISQCINDKYGEDNKTAKRDFSLATSFIVKLAKSILNGEYDIGDRHILNVNIPSISNDLCKGVQITQLAYRIYDPSVHKRQNPRGQDYYWVGLNTAALLTRDRIDSTYSMQSDFKAVDEGYISITPLKLNNTAYNDIKRLEKYIADKLK